MCHHGHCSVNYLHCGLGNNACARYDIRPLILVVMRVSGPLNFSFGWNSETSNNEASDCSIIIYWLSIRNKITNWSGLTLQTISMYLLSVLYYTTNGPCLAQIINLQLNNTFWSIFITSNLMTVLSLVYNICIVLCMSLIIVQHY